MKCRKLKIALLMLIAGGGISWAQSEPTQDGEGYYLLGTAADVEWFAAQVNAGTTDLNAKLTADITFDAGTNYGTIGNSTNPYKGTFDGQGHRIINRNVDTGGANGAGLFGYLNGGALVKNLIIDSSCSFTGNHVIGAFAGAMTGGGVVTFENCLNEAPVTATASNGASAAFVGASQGTATAIVVRNSGNTGTITCGASGRATVFSSYANVGSSSAFTNCFNTGTLSKLNDGKQNLVQWSNGAPTITNCYELSGVAGATQGIIADAGIAASGELCYLLNGDQSDIQWTQTIGTQAYPLPLPGGSQVYAHGSLYCDGTPTGAATVYNNEGPDGLITLDHNYTNGICSRDCSEKYQPATLDDGWYLLANAGNVKWYGERIRSDASYGGGDKKVKMTADIDMSGVVHTPIGWDGSHKFAGTFDGQGHRVLNMTSFVRSDKIGFFGEIRGTAIVRNIIIDSSCSVSGTSYVAGLIGNMNVGKDNASTITIENCINHANVTGTGAGVAGLVGNTEYNDIPATLVLQSCANTGTISGGSKAGAFVGDLKGRFVAMHNCYNSGTLSGGQNASNNLVAVGSVIECESTVDVSATANRSQGLLSSSSIVATGELCYILNGDQSSIKWTQTIGSDAAPVLGTASSQVYAHGQVNCDKTSTPGTVYDNSSTPDDLEVLGHSYTNGICAHYCDARFQPATLVGEWYELANAGNIEWFAKQVENGSTSIKGKLTADIDMSGVAHTPIGPYLSHNGNNIVRSFTGQFDGQGHIISNLSAIASDLREAGFFSRTASPAVIQNLGIRNASVQSTQGARAGVLGGEIHNSTVNNVYTFGTITLTTSNSQKGGHAGEAAGSTRFTNCWTTYEKISGNAGTLTNSVAGVTDSQVSSGEIAYTINSGAGSSVYYQTLPEDTYPVLNDTHGVVYAHGYLYCDGTAAPGTLYDNDGPDSNVNRPHEYTNGICSRSCAAHFQPAELVDGYYQLGNAGNVEWFSAYVAAGNIQINGKLTADIDFMNQENLHSPIGPNTSQKFNGIFDGQGHRIMNLILNKPTYDYQGFFGWLRGNAQNTVIRNLIIDKSCSFTARDQLGALAGGFQNVGAKIILENIVNEANVTGSGRNVGGLIGGLDGDASLWEIRNCVNAGNVTATGENPYAGALAGWLGGNASNVIENFINVGTVTGFDGTNRLGRMSGTVTRVYDAGTGATASNDYYAAKSATSGELAYFVNQEAGSLVFYQTLGTDDEPLPFSTSSQVYQTAVSGDNGYYANAASDVTLASMTLTDAADYAADANFTAESLTYDRTLAAGGYHSLCLPFAINSDMLSEVGGKLFTLSAVGTDAVTLTETSSVAAGTPCFASVTSNFNFGTMSNVAMVASVDNSGTVKGTFTNQTINAGFYKLSPDGTYFGLTTDGATATAFRSYIAAAGSGSVKSLNILLSDGTNITPTLSEEKEAVVYDLAGRRVEKATKGLYIINGKKVVK